jgi:hypothetical protein
MRLLDVITPVLEDISGSDDGAAVILIPAAIVAIIFCVVKIIEIRGGKSDTL